MTGSRAARGESLRLVRLIALMGWVAPLVIGCDHAPAEPRSKLAILISLDTLRADHLGIYGYPRPTSPNIDSLARDAVVFDAAQSTAPWTLPAHGALLTGRYPSRLGLTSAAAMLPPEVPTLAQLLQGSGWRTAALVNSRFVSERHGFDRGFDHFEYRPESYHQIGSAAPLLERALTLVDEAREQPLFLFLHLYDVHSDYRARHIYQHELVGPYQGIVAGLTPQLVAIRNGTLALEPADLAHMVDLYDAQIRELDTNLGHFFDALRERGWFDDALIALVADHGDEFLEHGAVMHGRSHHREVLRVPLVIRHTGWPRGRRAPTPVSTLDVTPTLLSALGVELPDTLEGHDLAALARGVESVELDGQPAGERMLFSEAALNSAPLGETRSVRQGRYTLHWESAGDTYRLYDLDSDPGEQVDLATREPETTSRLRAALLRFAAGSRLHSELREISREEREELRQLGYLDPSDTRAPRGVVHRN